MGNYLSERGWCVLALDNRGCGETTISRGYTIADLADDVAGLWRHLGISSSHLLGISMGGMIAMTLAVRRPKELASLVVVSSVPRWEPEHAEGSCAGKSRPEIEAAMFKYFAPKFAEKQRLLIRALVKDLSKAFDDPKIAAGTRAQRAALEGFDARAELSRIAVPTLVIHGGEDRIAPSERGSAIAGAIPGARLEIVPGVGHLLLAESARKFYAMAADFFTAQEGSNRVPEDE
jgi:pimeloyl-ACP methyl ester carboxylesterase